MYRNIRMHIMNTFIHIHVYIYVYLYFFSIYIYIDLAANTQAHARTRTHTHIHTDTHTHIFTHHPPPPITYKPYHASQPPHCACAPCSTRVTQSDREKAHTRVRSGRA